MQVIKLLCIAWNERFHFGENLCFIGRKEDTCVLLLKELSRETGIILLYYTNKSLEVWSRQNFSAASS